MRLSYDNDKRYREPQVFSEKAAFDKFVKRYGEKYPDIDFSKFQKIITMFNRYIGEKLIDTPNGIELPNNLGSITIFSMKIKSRMKDMLRTKLYGRDVYFNNTATDNHVCKVHYSTDNRTVGFKMKNAWMFVLTKQLKQKIANEFKNNYTKYKEMLSDGDRTGKNYNIVIKKNYNEFEL